MMASVKRNKYKKYKYKKSIVTEMPYLRWQKQHIDFIYNHLYKDEPFVSKKTAITPTTLNLSKFLTDKHLRMGS